ncbi:MAG: hypothetical protein U1E62_17080 [Alsobacter sp.]
MRRPAHNNPFLHNPALRLVVTHAVLGSGLGLLFSALLVVFDAHGLGTLIRESDIGPIAFVLLAGGFMVTFGSMVAGTAVMMIGGVAGEGGPGRPAMLPALVPVRVRRRRPPQG